jgi:succinate dehydrogenase subunit C
MNQATTPFHSKWYRERTSTYWWMSSWPYFAFIVREVSSVFVAWTVVFLLKLVHALSYDAGWYEAFVQWAARPWVVALNVVSLFFILFHTVTWFNLAPAAMVVNVGGKRVPGSIIVAGNYAAWIAATAVIVWGLFGG